MYGCGGPSRPNDLRCAGVRRVHGFTPSSRISRGRTGMADVGTGVEVGCGGTGDAQPTASAPISSTRSLRTARP